MSGINMYIYLDTFFVINIIIRQILKRFTYFYHFKVTHGVVKVT